MRRSGPTALAFVAWILSAGCTSEGIVTSEGDASAVGDGAGDGGGDGEECLVATETCESTDECCGDLECGTTTLGQVCCGQTGASCATDNGEDCCGELLCIGGICGGGASIFKAPFSCDQRWTYSHHSARVRLALDFIREDGGETNGAPVLASAAGVASQRVEDGGAGNYVVIDHGGGWQTYYFHLSTFSVADGANVAQGQEIGKTGTTGASSGPHIHYEQLLNGVGQEIQINGESLAPYPGTYGQRSITSDNGCP
jgi:hypothetical protein